MRKKLLPPIHPGEILREEFMKPLGLSANALAQRIGVTTARVNEIANERRAITADTALRLSKWMGTSQEFWLNLQNAYELRLAQRQLAEEIRHIPRRAGARHSAVG